MISDSVDVLVSALTPTISKSGSAARGTSRGTRVQRRALRFHERRARIQRHAGRARDGSRSGARGARRGVATQPALAGRRHQGQRRSDPRRRPPHPRGAPADRRGAVPGTIGTRTTAPRATCCRERCSTAGLRTLAPADGEAWRPDWICYYFINDSAPPSFVIDVSAHYETQASGARVPSIQFAPHRAGRRRDAADRAALSSDDREPRRASRRARRASRFAEGVVVREPILRPHLIKDWASPAKRIADEHRHRLLRVGRRQRHRRHRARRRSLAARGHGVHVLSTDTPLRLASYQPGLTFHRVDTPAYPLFREPQYVLSLANRIVQVARDAAGSTSSTRTTPCRTRPRRIWPSRFCFDTATGAVPRVITTLHGTDITLVGSDHSYAETVAVLDRQSDGVTAVSESLKAGHVPRRSRCRNRSPSSRTFSIATSISAFEPLRCARAIARRAARSSIIHISNFRPVKRVADVVEVFARIAARVPSRLLLIGDGPDLGRSPG